MGARSSNDIFPRVERSFFMCTQLPTLNSSSRRRLAGRPAFTPSCQSRVSAFLDADLALMGCKDRRYEFRIETKGRFSPSGPESSPSSLRTFMSAFPSATASKLYTYVGPPGFCIAAGSMLFRRIEAEEMCGSLYPPGPTRPRVISIRSPTEAISSCPLFVKSSLNTSCLRIAGELPAQSQQGHKRASATKIRCRNNGAFLISV